MASLNVAEWTPDQVAEWLSGLGAPVEPYAAGLRARGLAGARLLTLRCDDLEALGVRLIGHQELILEAVEHLRNFQYEARRECVQQLAARVGVLGSAVARSLRAAEARLDTGALADVARLVRAVKPLVCWLDRWPLCAPRAALAERKAALLRLALEAATCAQRDRFAEQPASNVAANALATAALADYIVQDVSDPSILQPASLDTVTLRQGGKPLGFEVLPSFCGHHQLARIRFGSPAHASGAVYEGDEIVQVGGRCVIGWSGEAVGRACAAAGRGGELCLRLRRRGARPTALRARARARDSVAVRCSLAPPLAVTPPPPAAPPPAPRGSLASSSDESEPLSPPASPTHLHPDHTRLYPPKPRWSVQRRHTVSGGSPVARRSTLTIEQFWRELREKQSQRGDTPEPSDTALYRRDKAVSCSTGLEQPPRAAACAPPPPARAAAPPSPRARLDKSHSTPAYELDGSPGAGPGALARQTIPESPTTPRDCCTATVLLHSAEKADQILDFKKSSSQIGEAILQQRSRRVTDEKPEELTADTEDAPLNETINLALLDQTEGDRAGRLWAVEYNQATKSFSSDHITRYTERQDLPPDPPPRPLPVIEFPVLRSVPRVPEPADHKEYSPLKPWRGAMGAGGGAGGGGGAGAGAHISLPLRHLTARDIRLCTAPPPRDPRPLNGDPSSPSPSPSTPAPPTPDHGKHEPAHGHMQTHVHAHTLEPAHRSASTTVRAMFPSAKSRSLKKKNSLLAKRRQVSARALEARGAVSAGGGAGAGAGAGASETDAWVWQRVRARAAMQPRWARRYLLLAHSLLYAYRDTSSMRADCMIHLSGFTVCAAGEVKSRAHAFKVYHTGTAFYFACASRDNMQAWIQLIQRATLLPMPPATTHNYTVDISKQFSETDYSETDTDSENPDRRDRDHVHKEKEKEKDKSKFGSLKKFGRRSESQENVSHAAASLDRKYLRFFSRHRAKDSHKSSKPKQGVPVPTEHYRSYRRVPPSPSASPSTSPLSPLSPASPERKPTPLNYIHASNPNLVDFEWGPPAPPGPPPPPSRPADNFIGFVTLEEFMLKKQEEERRQVYTNRVLMGIERDRIEDRESAKAAMELQKRLDRIVPDVIYGQLPDAPPVASVAGVEPLQSRVLPVAPVAPVAEAGRSPKLPSKPISIKGKDGYEKLVYPEELELELERASSPRAASRHRTPPAPAPAPAPDRWRDSLRRNDKVHSGGAGAGASGLKSAAQYTPLPLPAAHPLHIAAAAESWSSGGANIATPATTPTPTPSPSPAGVGVGVGVGVAGGAGVSRLRLMFSGGRSVSRDSGKQESPSTASAGTGAGTATGAGTGTSAPAGAAGASRRPVPQYPHLQCPPTFQPETYCLARLAPAPAPAPAPSPAPAPPPERAERERDKNDRPDA